MPPKSQYPRCRGRGRGAGSQRAASFGGFPPPQWIEAVVAPKWLDEHPVEAEFARIAKLVEADGHAIMTGRRFRPIGAEQPVPPGQIEAEIAIGLARYDRMMHAMHVWSDNDASQHAFYPCREADVAVTEHRCGVKQHVEREHRRGGRAKRCNDTELDAHRQKDLDGMEAHAGCHVEFEIRMVHAMQSPQHRHCVE